MITAGRNLFIVLLGFLGAFLLSGLGQLAFSSAMPTFSSRVLWNVDFATYALLALSALAYFGLGFMAPRWLKSSWPLVWLMAPIVVIYCLALAQPYPYRCNPFVGTCWMVQSIFVVPALAIVFGFLLRFNRVRHRNVV